MGSHGARRQVPGGWGGFKYAWTEGLTFAETKTESQEKDGNHKLSNLQYCSCLFMISGTSRHVERELLQVRLSPAKATLQE